MIYNLKNESIEGYNESENYSFPKYTSQLINWANQNAQGTRPRVVGQMSELFPEFVNSTHHVAIEYWKRFYVMKHPEAFEEATDKIYAQIENLREAIQLIDREMVERWVEDLIINTRHSTECMYKKLSLLLLQISRIQIIVLQRRKRKQKASMDLSEVFLILSSLTPIKLWGVFLR